MVSLRRLISRSRSSAESSTASALDVTPPSTRWLNATYWSASHAPVFDRCSKNSDPGTVTATRVAPTVAATIVRRTAAQLRLPSRATAAATPMEISVLREKDSSEMLSAGGPNARYSLGRTLPTMGAATSALSTAVAGVWVDRMMRIAWPAPVVPSRLSARPANRMEYNELTIAMPAENHRIAIITRIDQVT